MFVYHNGKRISRSVGSKKAAEKVARDIEAQLTLGEFSLNKKRVETTFGEYAQKWLQFVESQTKGNDPAKKKSTVEEYRGILKLHVLPTFKDYKINNIKMVEVRDHLISKLDTLSKKRVKGIMSVMSNIFELALEDETVDINPASKVSKRLFPKNGKRKSVEKTEVFTPDEIELFLDTCERDFPQFYQFFFMAVRTGLRLGELLALQWEDIDFNSKYVLVSRSYRKGRTTDTKTGQTGRTDISDQLVVVLKDHLKVCKEDALKQGRGEVTGLVFDYGRLNRESYIQRLYGRILKKAGLRYIKFHSLRHAFCAHLLSAGVSPYYVNKQARHSSINITCDVYGSWVRSDDNRHVNVLDSKHQKDPYTHPEENKGSQLIDNTFK